MCEALSVCYVYNPRPGDSKSSQQFAVHSKKERRKGKCRITGRGKCRVVPMFRCLRSTVHCVYDLAATLHVGIMLRCLVQCEEQRHKKGGCAGANVYLQQGASEDLSKAERQARNSKCLVAVGVLQHLYCLDLFTPFKSYFRGLGAGRAHALCK